MFSNFSCERATFYLLGIFPKIDKELPEIINDLFLLAFSLGLNQVSASLMLTLKIGDNIIFYYWEKKYGFVGSKAKKCLT